MKLDELKNIKALQFDLAERKLQVFHSGDNSSINKAIYSLHLDSSLISSKEVDKVEMIYLKTTASRKFLYLSF